MTALQPNPLSKYFREPGPYVKLPSMGYYYEPGVVEFTPTLEIPILPMTAYDELLLKNPDALLNGDAVVQVIGSCAPTVRAAEHLCSTDANLIMLAIRMASYGDELPIETKCPECGHESTLAVSIRYLLETITFHEPDYVVPLRRNVIVHMKPQTHGDSTRAAVATFEQLKRIQALDRAEMDQQEKIRIWTDAFDRLCQSNVEMLASQVRSVEVPEGMVTDREFITDFLRNVDTKSAALIHQKSEEIGTVGLRQEIDVECVECQHRWAAKLLFDPASFFA